MSNVKKLNKYWIPLKTEQNSVLGQRIALGIEYDGSSYHGWQRQSHAASVQASLEKALSIIADHPIEVTCAGRTDTAVHATAQVVHFDCRNKRPEKAWLKGANSLLPADIAIKYSKIVSAEFHARFSARSRSYLYIIDNSTVKPAILNHGLTWYNRTLDVDIMNQACVYFHGEQNFSSFRSSQCQSNSENRCITSLECERQGQYLLIKVTANAFLHHMVRNIVGVLLEIGDGRKQPEWAKQVIEAKNRNLAGVTAPAAGLYLTAVDYPECFKLPANCQYPLFLQQLLAISN